MNFSSEVLKQLKKAGWYEGRKKDISKYVSFLERNGNSVHQTVKNFLEEFGGLDVKYPTRFANNIIQRPSQESLYINPKSADQCHYIDGGGLDDYNEFIKKKLCAIGTARTGDTLLLMDDEGNIYACEDTAVFYAGKQEELFEVFCGDKELKFLGDV